MFRSGEIINPTADLRALAEYIERQQDSAPHAVSFRSVHGEGAVEIRASELTLEAFIRSSTLAEAAMRRNNQTRIRKRSHSRSAASANLAPARTVLLTGANGWLGRFLTLEWLDKLAPTDGRLVTLVRARDDEQAHHRLEAAFANGGPELYARFHQLAAGRLEVLAGDLGATKLDLNHDTWSRLADDVDLIVHAGALVNHVLPYGQLFGPNVVGTAEMIRLALTSRVKSMNFISTVLVALGVDPARFSEDGDIRVASPVRSVDSRYANGYANSKWAGEVLLREAHDLCGMPVTVFRCGMILAHDQFGGQLNVGDLFTRLVLSLIATGLAPRSFYRNDADEAPPAAHFDGLPVKFVAEAVATLGASWRRDSDHSMC